MLLQLGRMQSLALSTVWMIFIHIGKEFMCSKPTVPGCKVNELT